MRTLRLQTGALSYFRWRAQNGCRPVEIPTRKNARAQAQVGRGPGKGGGGSATGNRLDQQEARRGAAPCCCGRGDLEGVGVGAWALRQAAGRWKRNSLDINIQ